MSSERNTSSASDNKLQPLNFPLTALSAVGLFVRWRDGTHEKVVNRSELMGKRPSRWWRHKREGVGGVKTHKKTKPACQNKQPLLPNVKR